MDILGKERDRLQKQLDETQMRLEQAHEAILESHRRFIEVLDSAASGKAQDRRAQVDGITLFSQNRKRKPTDSTAGG